MCTRPSDILLLTSLSGWINNTFVDDKGQRGRLLKAAMFLVSGHSISINWIICKVYFSGLRSNCLVGLTIISIFLIAYFAMLT